MSKKRKILIVDDEYFNIMALTLMFESLGMQNTKEIIVPAINGQQAYDIVKQDMEYYDNKNCSFDLILMDCNMPVMDGYDATLSIRKLILSKHILQPIICAVAGHIEPKYV